MDNGNSVWDFTNLLGRSTDRGYQRMRCCQGRRRQDFRSPAILLLVGSLSMVVVIWVV